MLATKLRAFHAVAVAGGFTAGAARLNVGQPTVTSQVRWLEEYFGVELFHRHKRTISLTPAGQDLMAVTMRLDALQGEAADVLNAHGGFHIGRLNVSAVGPFHVTEMLAAFNKRYPDLKINVRFGNSRQSLEHLLNFDVDVAVLAHTNLDERFYTIPYRRHPVVAFVDASHPFAERSSISIHELQDQRVVLRETGSTTRSAFEAVLRDKGVTINTVMEIGSRESVWMAVRRGIGLSVVSEKEFIPHPELRAIPFADAEIYTHAHVVCLAERQESYLIRAFLGIVEDLLESGQEVSS